MTSQPVGEPAPARGGAHDYAGPVHLEYTPEIDREPDPGEVVWTWVAYEEDASIGKDRPVAVVGRAIDQRLVALMLSSQHHDGDRGWVGIGSGPWDRDGRPSWVRVDRVLAVPADAVRREGAVLPRASYELIVRHLPAARSAGAAPAAGAQGVAAGRRPGLVARIVRRITRR